MSIDVREVLGSVCELARQWVSGFAPTTVANRVVEATGASAGCVNAWVVLCLDRWRK